MLWALPDCPKWTCRAPFLRGRTSTSRLLPSLAAPLQSVSLPPPSLPPPSLPPPSLPLLSLPAAFRSVPVLLSSLAALLAARVQPRAPRQGPQAKSSERYSSSSLLLFFCAVAKVGNPLDGLGVVRNDPAVRLVMLHRALVIPEIQVAQNRKIPVRILEVGGLCQGRLITRARVRKLSLAPLHHTEFVIGDRLFWIRFQRLVQAGLGAVQVAGARVCNAEIDVRRRQCRHLLGHFAQQGDARFVPLLLQHAHCRLVGRAHFIRDGHALRDRVVRCRVVGDLQHRRSFHMTVDRAEEAAARFVFRVAARHQLSEPAKTLLGPRVEDAGVE